MRSILVLLLAAMAAFAAEDPWKKVGDLKSGTELRIYKSGAKQPLLAKSGEVTEDSLVVILKNEQVAIPKDQIERIDYRPAGPSHRKTEHSKREGNNSSYSSGVEFSKPDFETIYRRTTSQPRMNANERK